VFTEEGMLIETENFYFKITSIQAFNKRNLRGYYVWGLYQEKEVEEFVYLYFLEISRNSFEVYGKQCFKRRSDYLLDKLGLAADPQTSFVELCDEVLLATRDWFFENRKRLNQPKMVTI
jgi:hypothetical protein